MGVKKNFGYNLILTFCNYLFPLLVYPYVSRVLGVPNIGICNFVDSIINYFILLSMLGIGSYGVREIARCKDDLIKRNEVFTNLFAINIIMTFVSIVILVVCTFFISQLTPYKDFLLIGLIKIVFNIFLIEWFYQGIQQFKFITIRSVVVRCIYVICVFVFVQNQDDAVVYYVLSCLTIGLNAIFNWKYSSKFAKIIIENIHLNLYIKPVLVFGYYRILTSMYTTFNTTFLGFSNGDVEVAYFSTATKLYGIIMGVFSAFTTVMVPHVSQLIQDGNRERIQELLNTTISVIVYVSIPIIMLCEIFAPNVILLIAGPGYEGAIIPFKIVICLLLVIGLEQIIIQQFLMASHSNKSIFRISTYGAITGVLSNCLITPHMGAIGSSIAWGISELVTLFAGLFFMKKYMCLSINANVFNINVFLKILKLNFRKLN